MNLGIIAPESHSHVAVGTNVGVALAARGHRVTYLGFEDVRAVPEAAGLEFATIAPSQFPAGTVDRMMREVSEARGLRSSLRTMKALGTLLDARLAHLPDAIRAAGVDALVADQISPAASTVCEVVGIPFATVCAAVHMNYDMSVPPFFTPWLPMSGVAGRARNRLGYGFFDVVRRPLRARVNRFRKHAGLAPYTGPHAGMSKRCQITQLVPELDFSYETLPDYFHYVGPLLDMTAPQTGEWPVERLDGRPLVYCSFGTVNNAHRRVYDVVLEAMADVDAQLVLSFGGAPVSHAAPLPPGAIACSRVPQRQVLARCDAFITHAGANSALESLWAGVPTVCVPMANDQPGMAARLAHAGAGIALRSRGLSAGELADAVRTALFERRYGAAARRLRDVVRASPGAAGAAALIERALADRGSPT